MGRFIHEAAFVCSICNIRDQKNIKLKKLDLLDVT